MALVHEKLYQSKDLAKIDFHDYINDLAANLFQSYRKDSGKTGENMLELVISDNGIGIPLDMDFRKTGSLGLHLVTILAENQLHGKISISR
jgi:two-component sensor histidine kinase